MVLSVCTKMLRSASRRKIPPAITLLRATPRTFTPLALETRTHVTTADAAHHLCLSEQTLRAWSCFENGRIRPLRIPGRLGLLWAVADIKAVLGLEGAQ